MRKPLVIVHLDENHLPQNYLLFGDVELYIVDEGCLGDRVYQYTTQSTPERIEEVLGNSPVGSKTDDRHGGIEARVIELLTGKPRLTVVEEKP